MDVSRDALSLVLPFLSIKDAGRARLVCWRWARWVVHDVAYWEARSYKELFYYGYSPWRFRHFAGMLDARILRKHEIWACVRHSQHVDVNANTPRELLELARAMGATFARVRLEALPDPALFALMPSTEALEVRVAPPFDFDFVKHIVAVTAVLDLKLALAVARACRGRRLVDCVHVDASTPPEAIDALRPVFNPRRLEMNGSESATLLWFQRLAPIDVVELRMEDFRITTNEIDNDLYDHLFNNWPDLEEWSFAYVIGPLYRRDWGWSSE